MKYIPLKTHWTHKSLPFTQKTGAVSSKEPGCKLDDDKVPG